MLSLISAYIAGCLFYMTSENILLMMMTGKMVFCSCKLAFCIPVIAFMEINMRHYFLSFSSTTKQFFTHCDLIYTFTLDQVSESVSLSKNKLFFFPWDSLLLLFPTKLLAKVLLRKGQSKYERIFTKMLYQRSFKWCRENGVLCRNLLTWI